VHAGVEASKPFKPAHIAVVAPTLPVNAYDSVAVGFGDGVKLPKEDENAEKPATPLGTPVDAVSAADVSALVTRTAVLANHAFDKYLAKPEHIVKNMSIVSAPMTPAALGEAVAVAEGVMLARELCNDRSDVAHPAYFEAMARALGEAHADVLTVRVLQHDELVAQGYNLITAVGQAARHKSRIVVLEYKNADMPQPIAMVGKGVTHDSGGLNLKPLGYIENMHEDCGGASAVMGAMHTFCRTRPQKHIVGVLALAENAIDSLSYKPHAIIPSHIGSVQIGNTDAEGRLCLGDAMTHVQTTYKPSHVIDIATLTGACVVALGEYAAGVFSNSPKMASALQAAGEIGYERFWPLPILREHQAELKGDQADFNSTGRGRYGGSSTAASFLEKFVQPGVAWAHLDIAGAASASAKRDYLPKGASGFGVQTLYNYAK
jgi:leucyl aminopeptidase